ncbi:MAG: AmmeMemoRadiSam system protein B, partial [Planctomycetes bacterium]|nr:AmmeMemoRadiSam system protein B [Planctomycetota bacterium]
PHIDLRFGGASCKLVHAERARRAADAETVVVLGTGHGAAEDLFVLTRQSYATPLGVVPTDLELVEALVARLGEAEMLGAEILHAREHSVEFQALFLHLFAREAAAPPRLLPVLVGSFEPFIRSGAEPYADPRVRGFVDGMRAEIERRGRRVCYAASIDLSHLGPRYGDERGLSPQEAAQVEQEDRALLAFAEQGDAEGFFRHHQATGDRRRVCGFSSLYVLLRLLPGARGRLLRYDQSTFPGTADTVAHCAMLFEE